MTFLAKYVGFFTVVCDFLAENVGFSRPFRPKLQKIRILTGFLACRFRPKVRKPSQLARLMRPAGKETMGEIAGTGMIACVRSRA
jgi:hypothetical protein